MKKFISLFLGLLFSFSIFGQSLIGESKKDIIKIIKNNNPIKVGKPERYNDDGDYSISAKFKENINIYSFNKKDVCFFYIVLQEYSEDAYYKKTVFLDDRYLRVKDEKNVWKESLGDIFVYRWIVLNYNKGLMYTLYMTQNEYQRNKYIYLEKILK